VLPAPLERLVRAIPCGALAGPGPPAPAAQTRSPVVLATLSLPGDFTYAYRIVAVSDRAAQATVTIGSGDVPTAVARTPYLDYFVFAQASVELSLECAGGDELTAANVFVAEVPALANAPGAAPEAALLDVPELSQLSYEPEPSVRRRYCAPTCLAMVAAYLGVDWDFERWAAATYNAETGMHGVWPQMVYAANRAGLEGAVLLLETAADLANLLASRLPVIASLCIREGDIPDFPFGRSAGHMMVIRGIDEGIITVNDPAQTGTIRRRYELGRFMDVWRSSRPEIAACAGLVFWRPH
jgi:hypothetical protein